MAKKVVQNEGKPEAADENTVEVTKTSSVITMQDAIATEVAKIGPRVREQLIEVRVEAVLRQQVTALDQGFAKRARLLKDLKKIRPDQVNYSESGEVISETFSKTQVETKKKCVEQIAKIEKCLRLALDNDDYSELYKQTDNPKPSTEAGN